MNIDLRFPNITGATPAEQMLQMQGYLHQLVEQLNWALNTVESAQSGNPTPAVWVRPGAVTSAMEAENTFNSIKALIIKSADIVKAYETTILSNFNGKYFADSDFGTYLEETNRKVEENSKGVTEVYTNVQTITNADGTGSLDVLKDDVRTTNAYIRRGLLYYDKNTGSAVYGMEVGETSKDGMFLKYARFISDRLSFFDVNDNEVAYIGAGCLYVNGTSVFIGKAVFQGEIQLGGYKTDTTDGLAWTWIE